MRVPARGLGVVLAALTVLAVPGAAGASVERHTNGDWQGTTEQAHETRFTIDRTESGGRIVKSFTIELEYACDEGSGFITSFGACCDLADVSDGSGEVDFGYLFWSIQIRNEIASGTARYHEKNNGGGLHNCDSGLVRWRAEHLHPPG